MSKLFSYALLLLFSSLFLSPTYAMGDLEWTQNAAGFATPIIKSNEREKDSTPKSGAIKFCSLKPASLTLTTFIYKESDALLLMSCHEAYSNKRCIQHFNVVNSSQRARACGLVSISLEEERSRMTISVRFPGTQQGDTETIATALTSIFTQYIPNLQLSQPLKVIIRGKKKVLEVLRSKGEGTLF